MYMVCVLFCFVLWLFFFFFFFQAEDGIRDLIVTGVQTCALPISRQPEGAAPAGRGSAAGAAPSGWRGSPYGRGSSGPGRPAAPGWPRTRPPRRADWKRVV